MRGLRRYAEALTAFDRALQVAPGDAQLIAEKATTYQMQGDLEGAAKELETLPKTPTRTGIPGARINQWIYQRQYPEAIAALKLELEKRETLPKTSVAETLSTLGLLEVRNGDRDAGFAHAAEARDLIEAMRQLGDTNPWYAIVYGAQTYNLLGDHATALREAQHAVDAYAKDAFLLPQALTVLAGVHAQAGDADRAIATLERVLPMPCAYGVTPALLRLEPVWDPIRGDPRFQKLAENSKP